MSAKVGFTYIYIYIHNGLYRIDFWFLIKFLYLSVKCQFVDMYKIITGWDVCLRMVTRIDFENHHNYIYISYIVSHLLSKQVENDPDIYDEMTLLDADVGHYFVTKRTNVVWY